MRSESMTAGARQHIKLAEGTPFSDAVLVGDTLYLSGCIGLEPGTTRVPAQLEDEVRQLMENVKAVLAVVEMSLSDLVYVQVFCPDVSLWEQFNRVYCKYFHGELPARAFIGSGKLLFDAHFELQSIAIRSQ